MQENDTNPVMDAFKNVKHTVENLATDKGVAQVKDTVKGLIKDARNDFSALVNKDLALVKKKFAQERANLDKELKKQSEAARKFIAAQKKEIAMLQAKLEKLVSSKKGAAKKTTKKVPATRKAVKKVTKKVARKN
jgi:hypothetical protein